MPLCHQLLQAATKRYKSKTKEACLLHMLTAAARNSALQTIKMPTRPKTNKTNGLSPSAREALVGKCSTA